MGAGAGGAPPAEGGEPLAAGPAGNGTPAEGHVPERREPPREYHAEPRDSGSHEAAHFEPAPRPESPGEGKPYVVWSSTPPAPTPGPREE